MAIENIGLNDQGCKAAVVIPPAPIKSGTHHEAYPTFTALPLGHSLHRLPDDSMWPHAKAGTVVVVDCMDREVEFGEHFLILQSSGPCVWQFMRPRCERERLTVYLRTAAWDPTQERMGHFADGEIFRDALEQRIIGRVVGIFG